MEALRVISPLLDSSVGQNGVREGDEFVLDIFQDRKRNFRLNRTKYRIDFSSTFEFDFIRAEIKLPVFGSHHGGYQLELITHLQCKEHNHKSRYLLRSMGENPFRLNGTYCFEAFLERGDVVDLGFNRIHFLRPESKTVEGKGLSDKFIKSKIPVMIEGETGTGKTTLAKAIHEESGRSGKFVHLNLSAFSVGLIESELFGHIKGAFTGAVNGKKGAIQEAHKGTLFLDEIDSLSLDLQTKLLLFLDNYEVRPVGGESSSKVDVRMIFASGSELKERVAKSQMRKDFYFRLKSGCSISLESLRADTDKIRKLCQEFEERHLTVIDRELIEFYTTCQWPGNIRQLQSHLLKKKVLSDGKRMCFDDCDKELISDNLPLRKEVKKEMISMEKMKMGYCYDIYLRSDKNITRTAQILEICPNTIKTYLGKREKELRDDKVVHINF